jgi:hypothetical protein
MARPVDREAITRVPELEIGRTYSWDELGEMFRFDPKYLGAAGGMVSRPELNALLIITHPGGAKSFNYEDEWDGTDLIYTGRGKVGPQQFMGQNRDLGENKKKVFAFQPGGPRALEYLGSPVCVEHFPGTGLDDHGELRATIRFRLRFGGGVPTEAHRPQASTAQPPRAATHRRSRPFDPSKTPTAPSPGAIHATPEELVQMREKANATHHAILVALDKSLRDSGWSVLGEIPGAVDLWAERDGRRVIFEAKSLTLQNQVHQARAAFAQLLEYRHFYGTSSDALCIVTNSPLSTVRARFLEAQGVAVAFLEGERVRVGGSVSREVLGALT